MVSTLNCRNPEEALLTKKYLKYNLQNSPFRNHENECQHIEELFARTVECGESNSAILIGPRGSGKTTLVKTVLKKLLTQKLFTQNVSIVYLNGLINTDDKEALKSATVQLKLENAVNGKVFGSFSENLSFLLACLKAGDKQNSKSVIFILEEFDLFCAHHNQTLLYNLFDVAQSAQAPICVLGITCRFDVVELLEKRVKSRFSQRKLFLIPKGDDSMTRIDLFKSLLQLPTKAVKNSVPLNWEQSDQCEFYGLFDKHIECDFSKKWTQTWNKHIENLAKSQLVQAGLENMYNFDVCDQTFQLILFEALSTINSGSNFIREDNLLKILDKYQTDDKIQYLCDLSVMEFCLIIAMKHHSEIYDRDPFNFEMIFSRFTKFANTTQTMQNCSRNAMLKAFENLKNMEIIMSTDNSKTLKQFQMHKLLLTYGQINQAISKYNSMPTEVTQWAQSSLL